MICQKYIDAYTAILHEELIKALGCTEPISIAYCSAYATRLLGKRAEQYIIHCSGNIIKNVKAVTVPQTGGMTGIKAAVLIGAIGGNPDLGMQVLAPVREEHLDELRKVIQEDCVEIKLLDSRHTIHIIVEAKTETDEVSVEIIDGHTHLGKVTKNGSVLISDTSLQGDQNVCNYCDLSVERIIEYADTVKLDVVSDILMNQMSCNLSIAAEGLSGDWGANVGKTVQEIWPNIYGKIVATAAAGSDARMNGCAMPVVINSGSGNQGMTVSIPVVMYANEKKLSKEKLLRALCVANLVAIHQKTSIGKLSAFCGATCAAAGAACGIAYLDGADNKVIEKTLINTVATIGGMVCDGAKSSCAGKIAAALMTALLSYEMAKRGDVYRNGEGIVMDDVEQTITNIGRMASNGMRSTDKEILNILIGQ